MRSTRIRLLTPLLLLLAGTLIWNGCDLLEDTYPEATLEEVMKRTVRSGTDRYRLSNPRIASARENTGIVREESFFVILLGPDLEKVVREYDLKKVDIGVHVVRKPRTHLVLERLFTAEGEIDLFEGDLKVQMRMPHLVGSNEVPFSKFSSEVALDQIDPTDSRALRGLPGRKVTLSGFKVAKKILTGDCAETVHEALPDFDTEIPHYFLTSAGSDYLILNDEPMTLLMLDFLLFEKRKFKGGGIIEAIFNSRVREKCGVAGSTELKWVDLGGTLYYRVRK